MKSINKMSIAELQSMTLQDLLNHEREVWQYFQVTNKVREFKELQHAEEERNTTS